MSDGEDSHSDAEQELAEHNAAQSESEVDDQSEASPVVASDSNKNDSEEEDEEDNDDADHRRSVSDSGSDSDSGEGSVSDNPEEEQVVLVPSIKAPKTATKTKKKRKRKKKKKKGPKKVRTAFLFFAAEYRPKIKEANPELSFAELAKACGAKWKELTDELKQPYKDKQEQDKLRYAEELKNNPPASSSSSDSDSSDSDSDSDTPAKKRKKKKKKKKKSSVKRTRTSFMFFHKATRLLVKEANPDKSFAEITKLVGVRWKALTPEEREEYINLQKQDQERYQREIEAERQMKAQNPSSSSSSESDSEDDKPPKKKKKKKSGVKRVRSAYMFFNKEIRPKLKSEHPEYSFSELAQAVGTAWRNQEDRTKWQKLEEEDKIRFNEEREKEDLARNDIYPSVYHVAGTSVEGTGKSFGDDGSLSKGKKKKKKGTVVKKAKTAYAYFNKMYRAQLKENASNLTPQETNERIKEKWKSMDPEEKRIYDEMNLKDKERFKREMGDFKKKQREERKAAGIATDSDEESARTVAESTEDFQARLKKWKQEKKKAAPNRAKSAYNYFVSIKLPELKTEFPELKVTALIAKMGPIWKELDPEKKKAFEDQAEADKQRFNDENEAYLKSDEYARVMKKKPVRGDALQLEKLVQKKSKSSKAKAPKEDRSVPSEEAGKEYFMMQAAKVLQQKYPDWTEERRKLKAEKKWKTLSQAQHDQYARHAAKKFKDTRPRPKPKKRKAPEEVLSQAYEQMLKLVKAVQMNYLLKGLKALPAVEKESTLRDRIFEKGMRFKGRGPSDEEIEAFKQEHASTKEKKAMLAGLDTTVINHKRDTASRRTVIFYEKKKKSKADDESSSEEEFGL